MTQSQPKDCTELAIMFNQYEENYKTIQNIFCFLEEKIAPIVCNNNPVAECPIAEKAACYDTKLNAIVHDHLYMIESIKTRLQNIHNSISLL